jgi:tetratricopeptide (TPR) repeat protein
VLKAKYSLYYSDVPSSAETSLNKAIRYADEDELTGEMYLWRAIAKFKQGKMNAVAEDLIEAEKLELEYPDSLTYYKALFQSVHLKDYTTAEKGFKGLVSTSSNRGLLYFQLGKNEWASGDTLSSRKYYRKSEESGFQSSDLYYYDALTYEGDWDLQHILCTKVMKALELNEDNEVAERLYDKYCYSDD